MFREELEEPVNDHVNDVPINRLRSIINDTASLASRLRDVLAPVFRSQSPAPDEEKPECVREIVSPACQEIDDLADLALANYRIIDEIMERVQLPSFGPSTTPVLAGARVPSNPCASLWSRMSEEERVNIAEFARLMQNPPGPPNPPRPDKNNQVA